MTPLLAEQSTPDHGCRFYDTPHGRVYGVPAPAAGKKPRTQETPAEKRAHAVALWALGIVYFGMHAFGQHLHPLAIAWGWVR
jgi:hypothetical protein